MFCNKPKNVRNVPTKRSRKRKRKTSYPHCDKKAKQSNPIVDSHSSLAVAMSSWAQSYTAATTWQLKHQVAYWKARAKALEYQNRILHDTIRQNFFNNSEETTPVCESESSSEDDTENGDNEGDDEQEDDFEVSEEFIEFLRQNAKYKEDAKKEKERLKALREAENDEVQLEEAESSEEVQTRLKKLYGDSWEKIMCLETSVLCDFMNECDKEQPQYWPNIPFNFEGC